MQNKQNPYINIRKAVHNKKAEDQHELLTKSLAHAIIYRLPATLIPLPDIVFTANGGLSLPGLRTVLLPNMKYAQRQSELSFLTEILRQEGVRTMKYPGQEPFEGQAELKWFNGGRRAVCGYGHRSTKQTFRELDDLFGRLYGAKKPTLLVLPLASANYYHLDVAMCEYDQTRCIVHERAFSAASHRKLAAFLGPENVTVIDTPDSFCLNAVIDGNHMITHKLTDSKLKPLFERLTGRRVVEVPTTEFEKSGGSVRCMTLDLF